MSSGTLTVTTSPVSRSGGVDEVSLAWVATAGGAVSQTFTLPAGTIILTKIIPGTGTAPTADYTVAITDPNGISLMTDGAGGIVGGASLSATAAAWGVPLVPDAAADGKAYYPMWQPGGVCTLTIAAAGSGGTGTVNLYVDPGLV
jgi:hypothetical protein